MHKAIFFLLTTLLCTCGNTTREKETQFTGDKIEFFDIAFEDEYGLCAASLKTGKKTLIDPEGRYGCISKDGKHIAYTKNDRLYVVDFATRKARQIKTPWAHVYSPIWSPDNKWIAFYAYSDKKNYIGVTGKDYTEITTIAKTDYGFGGPMWAPDSKGLVYSEFSNIYVCELGGKVKKQYSTNEITSQFAIGNPHFMLTPNERHLVYLIVPDKYLMKSPVLITLAATDLQTMKWKPLTPRDMAAEDPFMDEVGNIYFRGGKYGSKDRAIYSVSINDSLPKEIVRGVTGFSIRNNVKVSRPIKLTSCDNCPKIPARGPLQYKQEVQ